MPASSTLLLLKCPWHINSIETTAAAADSVLQISVYQVIWKKTAKTSHFLWKNRRSFSKTSPKVFELLLPLAFKLSPKSSAVWEQVEVGWATSESLRIPRSLRQSSNIKSRVPPPPPGEDFPPGLINRCCCCSTPRKIIHSWRDLLKGVEMTMATW